MIRTLMASSALMAIVATGAISAAYAANDANTTAPAVQTQPAAAVPAVTPAPAVPATANVVEPMTNGALASDLIGASVYSGTDQNAQKIGDINDAVVDPQGKVNQVVIGVGGFLGIGEKDVAVSFDQMKLVNENGRLRAIYAATKDQLKAAPKFDKTAYEPHATRTNQAANVAAGTAATVPALGAAATTAAGTDMTGGTATTMANNQPAQTTTAPAPAQTAANATTTNPPATATTGVNGAATNETAFVSSNADQLRASKIMGEDLYGPDNKSIGEVSDIVLDGSGNAQSAIVDVGGFLGVGQKRVAIPFDQIQIGSTQDGAKHRLTVAMTKEQLQNAPAYTGPVNTASTATTNNMAANTTATTTTAATNTAANTTTVNKTDTTTPAPATTAANTAAQTTAANQQTAANDATKSNGMSADKLMGARVYGSDNKSVGKVDDLIFNKGGDIQAVVVDVGGFLGIGQKPVAIQYDSLNVQKDVNGAMKLMVTATEDQLKNAPTFQENK